LPKLKFERYVFQSFEYNIGKAKALARTHKYLDDIAQGKKGNVVEILQQIVDSVLELSGLKPIITDVQKRMENAMVVRVKELGQTYLDEKGAQVEKYLRREVVPTFERMFGDLDLLLDRVLLEQAIVTAVSAYEAFWKDLLVSLVRRNESIEEKFYDTLKAEVKYEAMRGCDDVRDAMGQIVAANLKATDIGELEKAYSRLFGKDTKLFSSEDSKRLQKLFEIRHIIVHNGGYIDLKFKRRVRTGQRIGDIIELDKAFVDRSVAIIEKSVMEISERIGYRKVSAKKIRQGVQAKANKALGA